MKVSFNKMVREMAKQEEIYHNQSELIRAVEKENYKPKLWSWPKDFIEDMAKELKVKPKPKPINLILAQPKGLKYNFTKDNLDFHILKLSPATKHFLHKYLDLKGVKKLEIT